MNPFPSVPICTDNPANSPAAPARLDARENGPFAVDATLQGLKIACFYPWNPFEPTGAWTRFSCLWRFLVERGADVSIAFFEPGHNTQLDGISVRYLGEYIVFSNITAISKMIASAQAMPHLKQFSPTELSFLLRYEKDLYLDHGRTTAWLDDIVSKADIVTCDYPMMAPVLSEFCRKWNRPLIVTCLDVLYQLHGKDQNAIKQLREKELHALGLADARVFCNDSERQLFAESGLDGVTVLNTGDVLAVSPGNEEQSRQSIRSELKLKTAHYCFFIGSKHAPNVDAVEELRRLAKTMPETTFVVAGSCCPPATDRNFVTLGPIADDLMDRLYRGALCVLVPLRHGTGMSIKTFHAFTYGKAVISTPIGARGFEVKDGDQLLLVNDTQEIPDAIRRLMNDEPLRKQLGASARKYALALDYRTHFAPYADIILRLTNRTPATAPVRARRLVLIDNNLKDIIGHHFNYARSLQAQCAVDGYSFSALIKNGADDSVASALAAVGVFSQGIHEDSSKNPYPATWGSLRSIYDFLVSNHDFARELEEGLRTAARFDDVVFLPNATPRQMLGLALLFLKNPIFRTLKFVVFLRYSLYQISGPLSDRKAVLDKELSDRYVVALERLADVVAAGIVRLATDSAELAKEYGTITKLPIEVMPIPHTSNTLANHAVEGIPLKQTGTVRVVYLGDAREEKGFELLLNVVRACAASPALKTVECVFQAFVSSHYHQRMQLIISEMERLKLPRVHLIKESLSSEKYEALLASADIILLPYDLATYRARTSGPFVEAACLGKPVVVPKNSWMSKQLGDSGAGTSFTSGNGQDFVRALTELVSNLPAHREAAKAFSDQFRAFHNPRQFLRQLMEPAARN